MKKVNKNLFVFIFSFIIIVTGLCSETVLSEIKNIFLIFTSQVQETGAFDAFGNMTGNTEKVLTSNLTYHNNAVDVYTHQLCSASILRYGNHSAADLGVLDKHRQHDHHHNRDRKR